MFNQSDSLLTRSVDERRAVDVVYLDFSKSFDVISCNALNRQTDEVRTR